VTIMDKNWVLLLMGMDLYQASKFMIFRHVDDFDWWIFIFVI
jgi:hypothetical protein